MKLPRHLWAVWDCWDKAWWSDSNGRPQLYFSRSAARIAVFLDVLPPEGGRYLPKKVARVSPHKDPQR